MEKHAEFHGSKNFENVSFGRYGCRRLITGETSVADEKFSSVQAVIDSEVTLTLDTTPIDVGGDSTITSITIPAGVVLYGRFTEIVVTSGDVIGHLG